MEDTNRKLSLEISFQKAEKEIKYKNTKQLALIISVLCLSTFYYGYCLTYLSSVPSATMKSVFGPDSQIPFVNGCLIGSLCVGAAFGSLISTFLMKILSRRNFILVINICALVVEGIIQYPNLYCLFVCRIFQGIFIGNFMGIVPIYINQLSPKQIVGKFGVFTQLFQNVGVVFSYLLGIILNLSNLNGNILWRIMFATNAITIIATITCICLQIIPESPNSLISRHQQQKAKVVIGMFYKQKYVDQVLAQKIMEVQKQVQETISTTKKNTLVYDKKAYFLGFQLPFMHQITGVGAIVSQVGAIVKKYNYELGFYTPLAINIVQLSATISSIAVLKRIGRRPIILYGNLGLGICDLLVGTAFYFISDNASIIIVFVLLVIYMMIYGTSLGSVSWFYIPQIIPAKTVPLAVVMNWIAASICIIMTPIMNSYFGTDFPAFYMFGGITLLLFGFNYFLVVQTKGLSTQQICNKFRQ